MSQMENCLYPFFWQHGESHDVLSHYMDVISDCGMKGVCIEARPHPDFVGDRWWSDLSLIIDKAKENDMKVWILDDSHFPTGYANGMVKSEHPEYLKKYIDVRRYDLHGPMSCARIDFNLIKGRPWDKPDPSWKVLGVYMAKGIPINPSTMIDVSSQMDEKRLLTVDVPKGAHSIFVVFQTDKGAEPSTQDYLNPLEKGATQVLIDEVYVSHYRHFGEEFGKTILGFFSDEPRFGNAKGTEWTIGKDMPLPWKNGLEKELDFDLKYLPLLWVDAGGFEKDIRFRYMDLVTKMYRDNFTEVLGKWCNEHGVWYLGHTIEDNGAHARLGYGTGHYFRGQEAMDLAGIDVIGGQVVPGMNYQHDSYATGGSNGEFYHYALAKLGTSAAHLDSKKMGRTMCEAFGAYGWNEGLKTMKWISDHLMVRGVNYIVPHAFDPKEFPDFDCPPHFYAHGNNPQFRYFKLFTNYLNRTMSLFRNGKYPSKVGLYYPAESEWAGDYMPVEKPARILTQNQISFDIVSRDYLLQSQINDGTYTINQTSFEVLVIPYTENIPFDVAEKIKIMNDSGVKVYFINNLPAGVVGGELSVNVNSLGSTVNMEELDIKLSEYRAIKCTTNQPLLVVGEYERRDMHYYMLFNESVSDVVDTMVSLNSKGMVYRYEAMTEELFRVEEYDGKFKVNLTPYEAAIYIVSQKTLEAKAENKVTADTKLPLPELWDTSFSSAKDYPKATKKLGMNPLGFVHDLPDMSDKCGTVRFEANVDIPQSKQVILDFKDAFEVCEVFVNNVSAGVKFAKPYTYDLSGLTKAGGNKVAIEVTNTLGTQIREPLGHYLVIEPFGIEGNGCLKINSPFLE